MLLVVIITLAVMDNFYFFLFAYLYFRYPFTMTMYHCYSFPLQKNLVRPVLWCWKYSNNQRKILDLMELYFGYEGTDFKVFN